MDRRLAVLAGALIAGAGILGRISRREMSSINPPADGQDATNQARLPPEYLPHRSATTFGLKAPLLVPGDGETDETTLIKSKMNLTSAEAPDSKSLSEMIMEIISSYPIDPGKRLELQLEVEKVDSALQKGELVEGTVVVDFEWKPSIGILVSAAIALQITSKYVRINFCDSQGNLRAPELDIYIKDSQFCVIPDVAARMVDLEERRSEAVITRARLKAISEGKQVHPGDITAVLARCRITGSPLGNFN